MFHWVFLLRNNPNFPQKLWNAHISLPVLWISTEKLSTCPKKKERRKGKKEIEVSVTNIVRMDKKKEISLLLAVGFLLTFSPESIKLICFDFPPSTYAKFKFQLQENQIYLFGRENHCNQFFFLGGVSIFTRISSSQEKKGVKKECLRLPPQSFERTKIQVFKNFVLHTFQLEGAKQKKLSKLCRLYLLFLLDQNRPVFFLWWTYLGFRGKIIMIEFKELKSQ